MPKVVTILTETRTGSQGFCERVKKQGQRLNPQLIVAITAGWANVGLRFNICIAQFVTDMWPIINDRNQRPFVSTTR